jgi:hypothetical protein
MDIHATLAVALGDRATPAGRSWRRKSLGPRDRAVHAPRYKGLGRELGRMEGCWPEGRIARELGRLAQTANLR